MNPMPFAVCTDNELVSRYEELRRQVLDRSWAIHREPGLALLIQRGMKAWMEVSSIWPNPPSSTTLRPSNCEDVLASEQRSEIILALASMALDRHMEANG
jgi:hypothetical protein